MKKHSIILTCGTTNSIEQIVWMNKQQFEQHLQENFNDSKIQYSDEYYDVLGIER